jgi:hypothetical protein
VWRATVVALGGVGRVVPAQVRSQVSVVAKGMRVLLMPSPMLS